MNTRVVGTDRLSDVGSEQSWLMCGAVVDMVTSQQFRSLVNHFLLAYDAFTNDPSRLLDVDESDSEERQIFVEVAATQQHVVLATVNQWTRCRTRRSLLIPVLVRHCVCLHHDDISSSLTPTAVAKLIICGIICGILRHAQTI